MSKYKKCYCSIGIVIKPIFLIIIFCNQIAFSKNQVILNDIDSSDSINSINNINSNNNKNNKNDQNTQTTELSGGTIVGERILRASESPYLLRTDLDIEKGAKLHIEPGVIIYFAPMVGITVRGSIYAVGSPEQKITFTTQPNSGYDDHVLPEPQELGARLVDGPTPLEGRLQIYHKGKWRSVCTNSRNWTIQDYETTCRQMGYQGGRFWNWVERTWNSEPRLLYEDPNCRGVETSLFECSWHSRQLGSGVCDFHSDIGIQCYPMHEHSLAHWRGISFLYAPTNRALALDNTVYESKSLSQLKHVDIIRAGSGRGRATTAAIEVVGNPPLLEHVTVDHSAYTGINITRPDYSFTFRDLIVRRSKGFGIFVNSSQGLAHFEGCNISENGADGIRYIGHDLRSEERNDRASIHDFCSLPTTAGQTYPISVSLQQSPYASASKECGKYFFTRPGYLLTVHFVYFTLKQNETAQIEIFDGSTTSDRVLANWLIRNSTRPQSITSTKEKIFVRFRAEARSEILGFLRFTTGVFKSFDLNVTRSVIADNGGRGIAVDNVRSQVHLHDSSVSSNGHVAGLHITSGSGDINVTQSKISFNQGDGINITYYGGNRNVSRSSISSNNGYGFAVWLNETKENDRQEFLYFNQTSVIEYSQIIRNLETGIRHGNFCGNSWVNITGNRFNDSRSHAIDIQSCWFDTYPDKRTNLQIGNNVFEYGHRTEIILSPILNLDGKIEYNHFRYGRHGQLFIGNQPLEEFRSLPVKLLVQHNQFYKNQGFYVVSLGLSPYGDGQVQSLLFTRNFVRDNKVREPFGPSVEGSEGNEGSGRLNPRSRVAAAVVIASNNIDVFRNIISNRDAKYEVGSQFSDQSQVINVTYNWLGNTDEEKIFSRLFHRKDRYDLAKIEYLPYLLHNSNPGASTIIAHPTFVPRFYNEGSDRIGGEVDGQEIIPPGTYIVHRDVNIRPGGKLILQPGVTLNFEPSVGMMIAGKLEARGRHPDDILFTLKRETVITPDNDTAEEMMMNEMEVLDIETESVIDVSETPEVPVRLLGGSNDHEGRLQVYLDGRWGTVCDYGWTITDAALVCHQLGLTLNPSDWRLQRSEIPGSGTTEDVILSNVKCTEHDIDITRCRSERASRGEFENSCTHENDVGIRCYEGAWAGLRFGVLAERADLQYVTVEKAGLFDYTTNSFKPAIQMDLARHNMENVRVVQNLHDGLGILYSDIFGGSSVNNVKNSEFSNNRGNGISLKQLGLKVQGSMIKDNLGSGINHDPVLSALDQRELAGWFRMAPDFNVLDSEYVPINLPDSNINRIDLDTWQTKHIITARVNGDPIEKKINIRCQPGYVIGIQLLNPIENRSTEDIWFLDAQTENTRSDVWQVKRDVSVFPATSSSYGIIMHYKSGSQALGGAVLMLSTVSAPVQDIRNKIVRGPVSTLQIRSTKIQKNTKGISATYYNRYLGERGEHYLRKNNESIKIINSEISHNRDEAFFVHAPFWDVHVSNLSEIAIHINNSLIMKNGRGIRQFSKDLRSSNNLFHYVLQDTTIEDNQNGGLELSLPYVWQYNENFTHSVYLGNDTWTRNKNFEVTIGGHFALVNISSNIFTNNECKTGLIAVRGMEKKMKIDNNKIVGNNGRYIFEFHADSLSEILGEVPAILTLNEIKDNRFESTSLYRSPMRAQMRKFKPYPKNPTRVIGFGGIQKVHIFRNLIARNRMDYDLVAGIISARLNNYLYAQENWWGSSETDHILQRIFDFDDWNNHAEVLFRPYLLEDSFDGSVSVAHEDNQEFDLNNFGGRILKDITLNRRDEPYVIRADITVMPDVTLTINHGVIMEFSPYVGVLVLGTLNAIGYRDSEIIMRPSRNQSQEIQRNKRSIENMIAYDTIRLCTGRNCSSNENEVDTTNEGFLEYFNHTTLQWVPICDRRFTERNAQVVCRELGYDPLDIYFGHDRRIEFHTNSLTRIWSWVEPMECHGDESRLELCPERLNGQLYGRRHECHWNDEFVFVSCNGDPDVKPYWGGIRFANPDFEQNFYEHRVHDIHTHSTARKKESHLEFVHIEQVGQLHNEKSPAIQAIFKNPKIVSVTIKDSVHHGINIISPSDGIYLQFLNIQNTLGHGINAITLTGEGRESEESSFTPLKDLDLPYHLFSMINICDTTKEITLDERVLIYYKYDNNPVNCVKIFNTAYRVKPLGFRLLQSNLFNHSKEYGRRDNIQLYDGDIYNISSILIGEIEADSNNDKNLFRTKGPTLSIRLTASGAPARHGFIAEVVTLPISVIGFNRDAQHNVSYSEISGAVGGAISYSTAGEVSPILTLEGNRFTNNCRQLYGNFSTCEAAIYVDVQNMQSFFFRNNLIQENQGGLHVRADSRGSATSLRGWIHHNLFVKNRNRPALYVEGRQSSPYQEITIYKNYISQNNAKYEDVIRLRQVVSNFTYNYVHSNYGGRIMEISGFDKVRLPIYQTTSHNGFYDNVATDWRGRGTIVAGTAGQRYVDNIFHNPDNDYEIITINRSIFEFQYWNSSVDVWKTKIDATHNYWSYNETISVGSRVRDRADDPLLLEVQFVPFHMNNETILDGKCPPGWSLLHDTCYIYVGAPMTFHEARDFCRSDNASLPFVRTDSNTLWLYLHQQMQHLRYPDKVWVQDLNYIDKCTSFIYRSVEIEECESKHGFVCEMDPKVIIDPLYWRADIFAIGIITAFILVFLLLALVVFCWYAKSRHRQTQRLERRNSIRQSLRSLNSIDPQGGSMRRRNFNMTGSTNTLTKSTATDYKKMTSNGSIDSMDKSVLSSEMSYDIYEAHNPHVNEYTNPQNGNGYTNDVLTQKYNEYANQKPKTSPVQTKTATVGSGRGAGQKPKVYALPDYNPQGFELSYRNEGFRDNSTFSGTRNNSLSTNLAEDTPIIHQTDTDDVGSDYYGNSSTLPLRARNDNLSFLSELKQRLPEYESLPKNGSQLGHSSFLPPPPDPPDSDHSTSTSTLPYDKKIDEFNFTPVDSDRDLIQQLPEIRRPPDNSSNIMLPTDLRRPDSYYTAVRSSRAPVQLVQMPPPPTPPPPAPPSPPKELTRRPKTVYEAADDRRLSYTRSKSEALLETNFDEVMPSPTLNADSRSYSQPLETAM